MSDRKADRGRRILGGIIDRVQNLEYTGIHMGIIRGVKDYSRTGALKVYIPYLGATPNKTDEIDPNTGLAPGEVWAEWTSPFVGITTAFNPPTLDQPDPRAYKLTQKSYGLWMSPPDIGNRVLIAFIGNNSNDAVILACLPPPGGKSHMIPSIPGSKFNYGGIGLNVPVAEKSIFDPVKQEGTDHPRPVHLDLTQTIVKQGLIGDGVRGTATAGLHTADINHTYGILTPGPRINPKDPLSHRGTGHQFVMDDTPDNRHIRLRTGGGNQILLNDAEGIIYLINKEGTAWVELSKDGSINLFGEGSINMRAKGSFNLRADKDVNIEAGKDIKLKAAGDMLKGEYVGMPPGYDAKIHTGAIGTGGSVHIESVSKTTIQAGTSGVFDAQNGDLNLKAANRLAQDGRKIDILSTMKNPPVGDTDVIGGISINAPAGPVGVIGGLGLNLIGPAGIGLTGVPILLNSPPGFAGVLPQVALPGAGAKHISMVDHEDLSSKQPEFNYNEAGEAGMIPNQGKRDELSGVESIVNTMLTAEPYAGHYVSEAIADANKKMMVEDETADADPEAEEPKTVNDPYAGYKTQIKSIMEEVAEAQKTVDLDKVSEIASKLNIPGIDLSGKLSEFSNFDVGPLKGEINELLNFDATIQGLLNVELPFEIPTLNSLTGDYVIGYAKEIPEYMYQIEQLQMDLNGLMAEASSLADMANNPMEALSSLAGDTISSVTKDMGIDNIKSISDVSSLTNSVMQTTGVTSNELNSMVNDVTNKINLGDSGDG